MRVRIATFNVENLFTRFKFRGRRVRRGGRNVYVPYTAAELEQISRDGWLVDKTKFQEFDSTARRLTEKAIKATNADILCLQEVESMDTLKRFVTQRVSSRRYRYKALIDGNDPRLIDVAVLSRFPLDYIITHQFDRTANNRAYVFSRDCLEVGVRVSENTVLPVLVNHFKSMMGGRDNTMARRRIQAQKVAEILTGFYGRDPGRYPWVVAGDLNDYMPSRGIDPLLSRSWVENVVDRIPSPEDRWTHYWAGGNQYHQLDYLLVSRDLAGDNPNAVPVIERRGMPLRATRYTGPRFEGVGQRQPKASDHCPVTITLEL